MEEVPLSREDVAILELEGDEVAGHTCKVIVTGAPGPSLEQLRERIGRGAEAVPMLRWILRRDGAAPVWIDGGPPDLDDHVAAVGSEPIAAAELPALVSRIFAQRLDRSQPLWRIDVAPLRGGGSALIWRIHHALADGATAMRIAGSAIWEVGETPAAGRVATARAAPEPPAGPSAGGDAGHAHDQERRRGHLAAFLRRELASELRESPFDGRIGTDRSVAFASAPFARLHDAARRLGGATVNDAVLAIVAGGLRRWIEAEHGRECEIRIRVPVSLHTPGDDAGNRDSFFTLPVDLREADPVRRLERIHAAAAERKAEHDAEQLDEIADRLQRSAAGLGRLLERIEASPRSFALAVSNVRGPAAEISVCGAEVTGLYSLAEIGRRHGLRVSAVSESGRINFGLLADPALVPDLGEIAAGIEVDAAALIAA